MGTGQPVERAILLSAGKGSRLLPLTADRPKCLLELSGQTLLEWQLDALFEAGIKEMIIVTGFRSELVETVLQGRGAERGRTSTLFNPFYHVADNLGSAWMARSAMDRPFLLLNGDTLISSELATRLIDSPEAPITVAIDRKMDYDADDMKVLCDGDQILRVAKTLAEWNAESVGMLRFLPEGAAAFVATAEQLLRTAEGTRHFFLAAVDQLARNAIVSAASVERLDWAEVDCAADLEAARELTAAWSSAQSPDGRPLRAQPFA